MKMIVHCKNFEITDPLHAYLERKIAIHLKTLLHNSPNSMILVHLETNKGQHTVTISIPVGSTNFHAIKQTENMYKSIDLVLENLKRQILTHKSKKLKKRKARLQKALLDKRYFENDEKTVS